MRVLAAFGAQRERKRLGRVKECARVECGTMLFNASEEDDTIFNEQERSARGFVVVSVEKKRGRKEPIRRAVVMYVCVSMFICVFNLL